MIEEYLLQNEMILHVLFYTSAAFTVFCFGAILYLCAIARRPPR